MHGKSCLVYTPSLLFEPKNFKKKTFCGFSMGRNQYGRVYDLCVYYMTGTPEGSTESGFMEKPGIEPATPGLQGIALIHYTNGVPFLRKIVAKYLIKYLVVYNSMSTIKNISVIYLI